MDTKKSSTNQAELTRLRELSARIGNNPLLTQASTGNSSIKLDGVLWIKASGKWMSDAIREDILIPLDLADVRECVTHKVDPADRYCGASIAESEQIAIATTDAWQLRAINRLQWLTVAWMCVEVAFALLAAMRAHSVALTGFGADSGIELLSAVTVVWRFRSDRQHAEITATKITGWLLVVLAIYIFTASISTFIFRRRPEASYLGMILLLASALVMPWLGRQKRRLATAANSAALRADAAQSSICAYLAWIALAGLLLNAVAHVWWADPLAALCLIPVVIKEAKGAFEGRRCQCC